MIPLSSAQYLPSHVFIHILRIFVLMSLHNFRYLFRSLSVLITVRNNSSPLSPPGHLPLPWKWQFRRKKNNKRKIIKWNKRSYRNSLVSLLVWNDIFWSGSNIAWHHKSSNTCGNSRALWCMTMAFSTVFKTL